MSSFIKPENFDIIVEAVKDVFVSTLNRTIANKKPLALKMGHSIKKMALLVQGSAIRA